MSLDDFLDEGPRSDATPPVPEIAAKAEDLEASRKSVEDSAAVSGGLWLSYLFVLFYLGVAAGAVTHADLLLQNPVKLPFLNIELPLLAFFFLAPLLFVISYSYTLVNLALLADRVRQFHNKLGDQLATDPALQASEPEIRAALTRQLPSNIFVQFLGGPDEIRRRGLGRILAAILWVTLVVAPIALLLLLQIQFLPYHNRWIIWINRITLVLDLGLMWWLWRNILCSRAHHSKARPWRSWTKASIAALLSVSIILFACTIATILGEWLENHFPYRAASDSLRGWIFAGRIDDTTRRRTSLFSNTLVLPGFNIYEALKIDDPKKVEWKEHFVDLRGRDLRDAVFDGAVLTKADFTGAQLEGASLNSARLHGAALDRSQLQGAFLQFARLQGATLNSAQLQGASLDGAALEGAMLDYAQLDGAILGGAQLQGATLHYAHLEGATLNGAQLQGATLDGAQLQGTELSWAQLQGATLDGAQLKAALVRDAMLWRAQLESVHAKDLFGAPNWNPEVFPGVGTPVAWTDTTYAALRESIEQLVPEGANRSAALKRVAVLDCATKSVTLAPCDRSAVLPGSVEAWKRTITAERVDEATYAKALATILGHLVCSGEPDRIYVLRGLLRNGRLRETGPEMSALAKRITRTECPLSTVLTDADKRQVSAFLDSRAKSP